MASETQSQRHNLDWLAFQYAAGELNGSALEAFELRMATDLAACEALARAVVLCEIVAANEVHSVAVSPMRSSHNERELSATRSSDLMPTNQVQAVSRSGRESSRASSIKRVFVLLSSAVCLAWMVVTVSPGPREGGTYESSEPVPGLASLWIHGVDQIADQAGELNAESTAGLSRLDGAVVEEAVALSASENVQEASLEAEDDSDEIPGWMLAAVAEQQRGMGNDPEVEIIQD